MKTKHTLRHIILTGAALALSLSFSACTKQSTNNEDSLMREQRPGTAASPNMEQQQPGAVASPSMEQQPMDQQPGQAGPSKKDSTRSE